MVMATVNPNSVIWNEYHGRQPNQSGKISVSSALAFKNTHAGEQNRKIITIFPLSQGEATNRFTASTLFPWRY